MEVPAGCAPAATLQGEAPTGRAWSALIERDVGASFRGNAPAGQRSGNASVSVGRDKKAGRARGLRGKAETTGDEVGLDFSLSQAGNERITLQAFFKGPGHLFGGASLDNEKARRVQPCAQKARAIRTPPFPHGGLRKAPQYKTAALGLHRLCDDRQRKAKSRRRIAIGMRLDFMQTALLEGAERTFRVVVGC